jgi:hypothetical protein
MLTVYLISNHAIYSVDFRHKEYVFSIDRAGRGIWQCESDAWAAMQQEDGRMVVRAIMGDKRAGKRLFELDEEFSLDVKLPKWLAGLIWVGWDEIDRDDEHTGKLTPEVLAREDRIDAALFPIIERYFLQEKQASLP